jgi:hypothetical protein
MTTVLAFDPGLITGAAMGVFTNTEPLSLLWADTYTFEEMIRYRKTDPMPDIVVSEVFESRSDQLFAADLSSVRVEGMLNSVHEGNIHWRSPSKKSQVPDQVLKDNGMWQTGSSVDWEDGRDGNDAIIHMLGYVAFDLRHPPTLRKYFKPNYGKVELRA